MTKHNRDPALPYGTTEIINFTRRMKRRKEGKWPFRVLPNSACQWIISGLYPCKPPYIKKWKVIKVSISLTFLIFIRYDPRSLLGPKGQSLMPWDLVYQTLKADFWGFLLATKMSNRCRAVSRPWYYCDIWSQIILYCGGRVATCAV